MLYHAFPRMTAGAPTGMQVERVLEDLIARLSRSEASKEVRAALIEARRLRSVTLTWTAIPPPPDARREMLSKVMDLVARVGAGAAPRPSAEVRAEAAGMTTPPPPPFVGLDPLPPLRPRSSPPPAMPGGSSRRSGSVMPPPDDEPPPASVVSPDRSRKPDSDPPAPNSRRHATPITYPERAAYRPPDRPVPERPPEPRERPGTDPAPHDAPAPSAGAVQSSPATRPDIRTRLQSPTGRKLSPIPFRKAPSAAADYSGGRSGSNQSITAVAPLKDPPPPTVASGRRTFGSGVSTQTNLARPLRTAVSNGVSLVRPQATAWQAYPRVPGAKLKLLWRDGDSGAYTALLHLAPGTTIPPRKHVAVEEMLLVEGTAMLGAWEMRAGEYCRAEAGSVHEVIKSDDGCTFFVTGSENDSIVEDADA